MYNICIFAGTTEGRRLVELLSHQPLRVTACVATEYGEALLSPVENLTVCAGRLTGEEMAALLEKDPFDLVVDATHPYAADVTRSIVHACRETETDYLRLLREEGEQTGEAVYVEDADSAVDYLDRVEGNILLTTGSKELEKYARIRDFAQRVYVRVLPMESSLELCRTAGVKPAHIIAMQGPFSEELNVALLRSISASYLVTKDGGAPGGFREKASAARTAGARLVVIGRPPQEEGVSLPQTLDLLCRRFGLTCQPEVTVVGIGPGCPTAMTKEVLAAVEGADCLIGGERMLAAVARPGQSTLCAIAPATIADYIRSHREHRKITVVMSGDTGFFSGTKKLLPLLAGHQVTVLPGISSLSYLCAKLQTGYDDVAVVSLHGRKGNIAGTVRRNAHTFALVGGAEGVNALCAALVEGGLGDVRVSVGERLSYPEERITVGTARELQQGHYAPLSAVLIENDGAEGRLTAGLPDDCFRRGEGEGGIIPMTKSEVRAVCLSKLRLTEKAVCWDIGAGTGSVAIEMALQAEKGQVFAVERREDGARLIEENRNRFALTNLTVVRGRAPEALESLPAPTHVFIGGSGGKIGEILAAVLEKNPCATIVATAISLESVAELTACMKEFSFDRREVVCLSVAKARPAGAYHLMTGQNPVYIFTMEKTPGTEENGND